MNKKITINEIAQMSGVSKTTVSRVLSNSPKVREETRKAVQKVITAHKYTPNIIAQNMRASKTNTIGLILADIENPFYSRMAKGAINTAESNDFNVIICNSNYDIKSEEKSVKTLIARQVDGIIITTVTLKKPLLKELQILDIPFILVDYKIDMDGVNYILNDDFYGGRIAAEYLINLGHKNIGFIGNKKILSFKKRYEGFKKSLEDNNLNTDIDYLLDDINDSISINTTVRKIINKKEKITALFAANDFLAIKVIDSFFSFGVKVPRDISLIGYDNIPLAATVRVPLTTISQLKYRLGEKAMGSLISLINNKKDKKVVREIIKPELVIRQSCIEL